MDRSIQTIAACLFLAAASLGGEIRVGAATIVVRERGCGFVDSIRFRGREVVRPRDEFVGASVVLSAAGQNTPQSLFRHRSIGELRAQIEKVATETDGLTITGVYSDGRLRVPFTRRVTPVPDKDAVTVREEADFTALPADRLVARHSLAVPLVVCEDEHLRLFAFGGTSRAELFRMDQNDERRRNQNLSDNRAFQPYWDLGGVVQLPDSYRVWRANHADTLAYPVEDGLRAPGWADYSEPEWGITVQVSQPRTAAPWAVTIDARDGVLTIAPRPPDQIPVSGKAYGRRAFEFVLTFHESSWPATYPCELDFEQYKRFLDYLNQGRRYTHLNYVCGGLGVSLGDGKKSPEQMQDAYRRIIFKERVQPSVLLRLLYRGDAWRMSGLARAILGKSVPRNQPLPEWEKIAAEILVKIRAGSLPAPKE